MILENHHQKRTRCVEPETHFEGLDQPRRARYRRHAVDFGVVQDEIDRDPKGAKVEALVGVMQRALQRGWVGGEAEGDEAAKGEEEHEVQNKKQFADRLEAAEREGLLGEEHGHGACGHGGFEPCPGEVGETVADGYLFAL